MGKNIFIFFSENLFDQGYFGSYRNRVQKCNEKNVPLGTYTWWQNVPQGTSIWVGM